MLGIDELAYSEGFTDGQENLIDEIFELIDSAEGRTEAYEAVIELLTQKKKEIESL